MYIHIHVSIVCVCTYLSRERKTERERETERERAIYIYIPIWSPPPHDPPQAFLFVCSTMSPNAFSEVQNPSVLRGFLHFTYTGLYLLYLFVVYVNHPKPKPESGLRPRLLEETLEPFSIKTHKDSVAIIYSVSDIFFL